MTQEEIRNRLGELRKEFRHKDAAQDDHNQIIGLLELIWYTKPQSVLEIGAHAGVSTETFALTCEHVVTIDPWEGYDEQFLPEFNARMDKYDNVHSIRGKSPQALERFVDNAFDLCYIDGDHRDDAVLADLRACERLVRPGGWFAGHDSHIVGVMKAVREVLGPTSSRAQIFRDRSWLVKKATQTSMRFVETEF